VDGFKPALTTTPLADRRDTARMTVAILQPVIFDKS